jgi:bacterioferritin (cytochrome b1)
MGTDLDMIRLFSYYRDAELRGAALLLKLIHRMDDAEAQVKLARHLADETRHAWLWTKRITELGGTPVRIADGYQTRIGREIGIPKTLTDILALTVVVEERSERRYLEHAQRAGVDPNTLAILQEVTKDEKWHIGWMRNKLEKMAAAKGEQERAVSALQRYREVDREVFATLVEQEREKFGFSFSDNSAGQA